MKGAGSDMGERVERRLTTIMVADVVEYSRLMQVDDEATLAALSGCQAIVVALIAEHRGRIVNMVGDSILAEFPSVADCLRCAVALQRAISEQNEEQSAA